MAKRRLSAIEKLPQVQEAIRTQHGPLVRCIDCGARKAHFDQTACDRVRINKYARQPCARYYPDLDRMEKLTAKRAKQVQ